MSQPARNRHEVDSAHNAVLGEKMPKVVKTNARQSCLTTDELEGFPQTMGVNVTLASLRARKEKAYKNL
jgi:hypothetical protein